MIFKLYNKLFKSAYNFSIFKTFMYNLFIFKTIKPKLYLGKKTSIINRGGIIKVYEKSYFDCKNSGQFFYDSHIVLENNSKLILGKNVNFFGGTQIKCFENAQISIGNGTYFSGPITIHSKKKISIGKNCSISWGVTIIDSDFHSIGENEIKSEEVIIEDNVWIGCNVTILKGSYIPSGSIIAAKTVVTKPLNRKGVYAGNPARLIRELDE